VSSIKDRQRAAARARLEREMAARAAAARKRRQTYAVIGAGVAVLVLAAGTVWLVTALNSGGDKATSQAAASAAPTAPAAPAGTANCAWNPDTTGNPSVKDVGTPPNNVPALGADTLTIDTSLGPIQAKMDRTKVPCTAASFRYLATKHFYDGSKCHRLVDSQGLKVLQCGDPSAKGNGWRPTDGQGGPTYKFAEENLPTNQHPTYPRGTIAMAKTQEPATTGSQFFIVYGDSDLPADYTVVGTITSGLQVVDKIAKAGFAPGAQGGDGHPKLDVVIKSVKVTNAG
jgi:peptidyl-prolyl cis-trans isomerase B (cyclophilin B)